jgi:hypothetical protein
MSINFNTAPYFDDFDEAKKFQKILFRPGAAVQTRELNQLQSLYQKQLDRFGQGIYKEGAMVIPGGISLNKKIGHVKLTSEFTSGTVVGITETFDTETVTVEILESLIGLRVVGLTSNVEGIIKYYRLEDNENPLTLYVEYDTSNSPEGATVSNQTFNESETLEVITSQTSKTEYASYRVTTALTEATGDASLAEIERGVYFVRGYFVLVEKQTIILDPYSKLPSYRVGLSIEENIVTPEEDSTLYDNANGSFNFSAPGAHRYKIELVLSKLAIDSVADENFIELLQTEEGEKVIHVTTTEYSEIARELAHRTYDESGNYTVQQFRMSAKESRDNNRGQWTTNTEYLLGDVVTNSNNFYVAVGYAPGNSKISGNTAPIHVLDDLSDGNVIWAYEESPQFNGGHSITGNENQVIIAAEPGKAYVRGYKITKSSTNFIPVDKAREYREVDNDLIPTTIGSYVLVRNIVGTPDFTNFIKVNLKAADNATVIGTARIRGIEKDGANYRFYLFGIELNENKSIDRDVKYISNLSGTVFNSQVANVVSSDAQGSISVSTFSVTGSGTRFTRDFASGDYIDVTGTYYTVDTITSDELLTITTSGASATNVAYKIHRSGIGDPTRSISVFPLGRSFIKSTKTADTGTYDMQYTVMQRIGGKTASAGGQITVSISDVTDLTGSGSKIDPNTEKQEIIVTATGESVDAIFSAFTFVINNDSEIVISGLTPSTTYTVFFPVIKNTTSTVTPKTKTPQRFEYIDITEPAEIESRIISLQKADVFKIRKVLMAPTVTETIIEATATDITNYFELDDGQRDTHYGVSRAIRKPNNAIPTGSLRIYFDYFMHTGPGDYFSVDSYVNTRREEIPIYSTIYGIMYLADALDFRPRISNDGTSFTGTGSSLALPPKPGTTTEVDYTYYIPRIDKISMDIEGKFLVTRGVAAESASAPETPDLSMHLATLTLAPYTVNSQYVNVQRIDNRRFTMRDIGKLEKRIENLEYYTSLSLLEQQASTLTIPDEFGVDRFKNGFIVDNFAGHTTGDIVSPDYRAAIDMEMKELRPSYTMNNVNLIEQASTDFSRAGQGYQITGDIITLPYTEKELISQKYASRPENVNPFAVFTFIGSVEMNPPSDEWIETARVPQIINDIEGNFSSVLSAEKSTGTLGTIWNGWQTQWTGTQVTGTTMVRAADFSTQDFGIGAGRWMQRSSFGAAELALINSTPGGRVLTSELVATSSGQSRTGINTEVRATFSKEFVNDRVVSTSVVPYIRSRKIAFLARGLKLQTIVYPFFNEVNVSEYVTPASRLTFRGLDVDNPENMDLFDFETNVGRDNDDATRSFDGNTQSSYNKGDVIFVRERVIGNVTVTYNTPEQSPATAVCILQEVQPGGTERSVLIVNIKGSFSVNDKIRGTISGSEGILTTVDIKSKGSRLVSNFGGDLAGVFDIPSTDALKFPTGTREFKLIDNLENSDLIAKTRGFGSYHAEGVLQTWQATYNSVRNAEVVRTVVTEDRTIVTDERVGRLIRDSGWYDPLAQTFLIQNRGGAFITSVDVWFASVDPVKPITMQIREVVNGYPGKNILPFSTVTLYPYELRDENQPDGYGLSSNSIEVEGGLWLAADKPTKFKMKAPVFVQDVGEYCVVLLSNSNNYNVWTSELGGIDITSSTPRLISEQPYAGVLFKSQNASTWTAHQNEDLMFKINIANFNASTGSATFVNARLDSSLLENNPFLTRTGSKLVRVYQRNHGLTIGSKVTLSGLSLGTYNGISSTQLNALHNVLHVEHDSFVIKVTTEATATGRIGGLTIKSTKNIQFDTLQPIVQLQNFSDTTIGFSVKTMSGNSVTGSQSVGNLDDDFIPVLGNDNNEFPSPRMIASAENETLYLEGQKSFYLKVNMATNNASLSPVIDTSRVSLITVNNRINNANYLNYNYIGGSGDGDLDVYTIVTSNTTVSFSGSIISATDDVVKSAFKQLRVGKYIRVSGSAQATNNSDHLIIAVAADGSSITTTSTLVTETAGLPITIKLFDNFIDEIALEGSASAKYLTRKINLSGSAAESKNLNIRFAADIPSGAVIDVYYKTAQIGSAIPFNEVLWVKTATATTTSKMADQSFEVRDLSEFNAASVKLVMRSSNSSAIPRVKDLIIIATA